MPQRYDLFPAETYLPDGRIVLKARVIVEANGDTQVWKAVPGESPHGMVPQLAWEGRAMLTQAPGGPHAPARQRGLTAETTEGMLRVTSVGGCACGGTFVLQRIEGIDT